MRSGEEAPDRIKEAFISCLAVEALKIYAEKHPSHTSRAAIQIQQRIATGLVEANRRELRLV